MTDSGLSIEAEADMVVTWNIAADADYYARESEQEARESYYHGGKEPPGRWYAPAGDFGLIDHSPVEMKLFQRLCAGIGADGKALISKIRGRPDRVPAYDLTFSVPRSVSLIWAFAPPDLRQAIEEACYRAFRVGLGYLEREGTYARRGHAGALVERVSLSAALFQHRESRPCEHADGKVFADPNFHLHGVCYNMSTRADGTVGAIYSIAQRNLKMCVGSLTHAALCREIQALGFEVDRIGPNGVFEISGVEASAIEYFSSRRQQIVAELAKHGTTSKEAGALASAIARATRGAKDKVASAHRQQTWAEAAIARGIDIEAFSERLRDTARVIDIEAGERLFAERLSNLPRILTDKQSVFERQDLLQAVAVAHVGTGLPTCRIDEEIQRFIDIGAILEIGRDRLHRPRYSTPEIMKVEREIVALTTLWPSGVALLSTAIKCNRLCKKANLSVEQTEAVLAATANGSLAVISGAPGSGKTTSLFQISQAYKGRCLGAASAWRTSNTIKDDLSIPSRALASWLAKARVGGQFLTPGDVLIVDEAGLVNARDMHALLTEVDRAGAKVILVGDTKQLQAIGGPGLGLVQRAIEGARIETIVRQRDPWMRDAIYAFGDGRADEALQAFADRGHVVEVEGSAGAVAAIVERWRAARAGKSNSELILLARANADVAAISRGVREVLRSTNEIDGPEVEFPTVTPSGQTTSIALARGDRIRFLTRNDSLGVVNGTTEIVIEVHTTAARKSRDGVSIRIKAEVDGRRVEFSPADLADGKGRARLGWAYASSVYSSQGMTVDEAIVWVDPNYDKHQIYVSASRARMKTTFVVDRTAINRHLSADLPLDQQSRKYKSSPEERQAWLAKRLSRSAATETTLDVLGGSHEFQNEQDVPDVDPARQKENNSSKLSRNKSKEILLE